MLKMKAANAQIMITAKEISTQSTRPLIYKEEE